MRDLNVATNPMDLIDVELAGIDTTDCPDFSDAYATFAFNERLGRCLTSTELSYLNENHNYFINELATEVIF